LPTVDQKRLIHLFSFSLLSIENEKSKARKTPVFIGFYWDFDSKIALRFGERFEF
jgi:hypothetical protein